MFDIDDKHIYTMSVALEEALGSKTVLFKLTNSACLRGSLMGNLFQPAVWKNA